MAHMVVYCNTQEEGNLVREQLVSILDQWEEPLFYREFTGNLPGFLHYVKGNPYLIILVVQSGPEGKETVRLAKEANPKSGIVWFAAEDYALDAFAFHITHFALLPMDREKLMSALYACRLIQDGPHISAATV